MKRRCSSGLYCLYSRAFILHFRALERALFREQRQSQQVEALCTEFYCFLPRPRDQCVCVCIQCVKYVSVPLCVSGSVLMYTVVFFPRMFLFYTTADGLSGLRGVACRIYVSMSLPITSRCDNRDASYASTSIRGHKKGDGQGGGGGRGGVCKGTTGLRTEYLYLNQIAVSRQRIDKGLIIGECSGWVGGGVGRQLMRHLVVRLVW